MGQFGPVTQSVDAVKALLSWRGRASEPLPTDVSLDHGRIVLALSNKKDCYFTVSAAKCSCPAAIHSHEPCAHQKKFFAEVA